MAIPNLKPQYDVRSKVRIGEKKGKYPSSLDYFVSDDPEIQDGQRVLRVRFPYADVEDNFSTGLEWWVKTQRGSNQLACYTKDSSSEPVALRLEPYMSDEFEQVAEKIKTGRLPIRCPFRSCPQFQQKKCKPMGRLVFFVDGGRTDQVLQLDTKSWNSIEKLTGTLDGARLRGDLRGRVFELSVAFVSKGTDRFPVLSLEEVSVDQQTKDAVNGAEAQILAAQAGRSVRDLLIEKLRARGLDPKDPKVAAYVNEIGIEAALMKLEGQAV